MTRFLPIIFLSMLFSIPIFSQEIGYGFKAGLSFSSIRTSDFEKDADGNELEQYENNTGFHVAGAFSWKATDLMGVRLELMFSQKGARYTYDGPSYYTFISDMDQSIYSSGNRKQFLNLTNSYIDIPIMGYAKIGKVLEFSLGVNAGFLVASTATGELVYTGGVTSTGSAAPDFRYDLDYRYGSDDPREADFDTPPTTVTINGGVVPFPRSAGAYYEKTNDDGRLYQFFEFAALAGISIYLNEGLYVGGRLHYSLIDITKKDVDVALNGLDGDNNFVTRDDDDRSLILQASVGFSF